MIKSKIHIQTFANVNTQRCKMGEDLWSVSRLIHLSKDFEVLSIPLIHLNISDCMGTLLVREFVTHMKAAMQSDLDYPIILDEDGAIMDGRHRIIKALYLQHDTIKAVRFSLNPEPCEIVKGDDDEL